jgi:hypothetical protein
MDQNISLEKFETLCKEAIELNIEKSKKEEEATSLSKKLTEKKLAIMSYMDSLEKTKYFCEGHTLFFKEDLKISFPEEENAKKEFIDYFGRDNFYNTAKIHANTLNSWYKAEMEKAAEEKNFEFKVPGIREPQLVKTLVIRKS